MKFEVKGDHLTHYFSNESFHWDYKDFKEESNNIPGFPVFTQKARESFLMSQKYLKENHPELLI